METTIKDIHKKNTRKIEKNEFPTHTQKKKKPYILTLAAHLRVAYHKQPKKPGGLCPLIEGGYPHEKCYVYLSRLRLYVLQHSMPLDTDV